MKRKIAIIFMVISLIAALTACGSDASSRSSDVATAELYDAADAGYVEEYSTMDSASTETSSDVEVSESAASDTDEESSYEQKLIRTVNMDVETTEYDAFIAQIESKTEEMGGYVESSETSSSSSVSYGRWGSMTIRIPADSLDEFLVLVGENANVTYKSESTEDVTLTYVDLESRLTALRTEQESLLAMLDAAETVEDIIAIQSQLTEVNYEIESYESQLRVYDNKINYSTVYLYIDEVLRETSAADETFWGSVATKFSDNLYSLVQGLRSFVINFLGALPIIIAVAVPVVMIVLIVRAVAKRRKKKPSESVGEKVDVEKK